MKVLIGLGAYGGMVTTEIASFLFVAKQSAKHDIHLVTANMFGHANMRNAIVAKLMAGDYEALWFLDHDVLPPPNALDLLDTDADIATGYYKHPPLTDSSKAGAAILAKDGEKRDGDVWTVRGTGMGATVIHRRVFEHPDMKLSVWPKPTGTHTPYFQFLLKADGSIHLGEDFDFCGRATDAGFRVAINNSVVFGHRKSVVL